MDGLFPIMVRRLIALEGMSLNMVITFGNAHVGLDSVTIIVYIFSHSCLLPKKTKLLYQVFLPAKAGSHCI